MALLQSKGGLFFFDEDSSSLNEVSGFRDRVRAILVNQLAMQPGCLLYTSGVGFHDQFLQFVNFIDCLFNERLSSEPRIYTH